VIIALFVILSFVRCIVPSVSSMTHEHVRMSTKHGIWHDGQGVTLYRWLIFGVDPHADVDLPSVLFIFFDILRWAFYTTYAQHGDSATALSEFALSECSRSSIIVLCLCASIYYIAAWWYNIISTNYLVGCWLELGCPSDMLTSCCCCCCWWWWWWRRWRLIDRSTLGRYMYEWL